MPSCSVLVLEKHGGPWCSFLEAYFSDTPISFRAVEDPAQAAAIFDKFLPRVVFLTPDFLNKGFRQKLKVRRNTHPAFRVYGLGNVPQEQKEGLLDAVFPSLLTPADFNKRFVETLPVPDVIRLLVVDDEEEVGVMARDYFEGRRTPAFEITCAANGREAFTAIARQRPEVIILDIKMPVMDGREFYAKLKAEKADIPVIVFFDSISGEELSAMRRFGNPAVVEKGLKGSSLPTVMQLVKKLVFFSTET